jgi:hypothetical protein
MPPLVTQAIAEAPAPPAEVDPEQLPTARDLARGIVRALDQAQTAQLSAQLPQGGRTDLKYVAPDRADLVELDANGAQKGHYIIIGDTGYTSQATAPGGWLKNVHPGYRQQAQIFRPIQVALATGEPQTLESGQEVELVEVGGRPVLHAVYGYRSSPELEALGLMRSGTNLLEVWAEPTTWRPIRTKETTRTGDGTEGAVTDVRYQGFNQPLTVDPPIS